MNKTIILDQLAQEFSKLSTQSIEVKRWVVGFSGGVDSTVLLHAVMRLNEDRASPKAIVALHINHQLSSKANHWEEHCRQQAESLGVEFQVQRVAVTVKGKGVEAAAREQRYQVFEQFLETGDCLLLGHHQQDQAETVLFRLLRGAGVRGLGAIPTLRSLGKGFLFRPLLTTDKSQIEDCAQFWQLPWIEDESNQEINYDRNFLRQQCFPILEQRWAGVSAQLAKTAARMQETDNLLLEFAAEDWQQLNPEKARTGYRVHLASLKNLSRSRRQNTLRYGFSLYGLSMPESDHWEQIEHQFFSPQASLSRACVRWGNTELRQFAGFLYLQMVTPEFIASDKPVQWDMEQDLNLDSAGSLKILDDKSAHMSGITLPKLPYEVRWRQGGERCTPVGRQQSQIVKKLLQEYSLETWLRDRVPLIYFSDELIAVGDLWVNQSTPVVDNSEMVTFQWCFERH